MVLVETLEKASDQMGLSHSGVLKKPGSIRDGESRDKTLIQYEAFRVQSLQLLHPLDCGFGPSRSDVCRLFLPISGPLGG